MEEETLEESQEQNPTPRAGGVQRAAPRPAPVVVTAPLVNKAPEPEETEVPTMENFDSEEATVSVPEFDGVNQVWGSKLVTKSEAVLISAQMMREPWEQNNPKLLDTEYYDKKYPGFAHSWVPVKKDNPATMGVFSAHYARVQAKKGVAPQHHSEKVAGWGTDESVVIGDMILVQCPITAVYSREASYQRRKALQDSMSQGRRVMDEAFNERGLDPGGKDYYDESSRREEVKMLIESDNRAFETSSREIEDTRDRARMSAASVQEAQARARRAGNVDFAGGTNKFGSFQGRDGFNGAVPESPYLRRLAAIADEAGVHV